MTTSEITLGNINLNNLGKIPLVGTVVGAARIIHGLAKVALSTVKLALDTAYNIASRTIQMFLNIISCENPCIGTNLAIIWNLFSNKNSLHWRLHMEDGLKHISRGVVELFPVVGGLILNQIDK